jgi:flagellar hook-length control protein FliK
MPLPQPPFIHPAVINAEQINNDAGAAAVPMEIAMSAARFPISGAVLPSVPDHKHADAQLFPDDIDYARNRDAEGNTDLATDTFAALRQPVGTAAPGTATETNLVPEPLIFPASQVAIHSSGGDCTAPNGWTEIRYSENSQESNLIAGPTTAAGETGLVARLEQLHQDGPSSEPRTSGLPRVDAVGDGIIPENDVTAGQYAAMALSPDTMISVPAGVVAGITHGSNIAMTVLSSAMPTAKEHRTSPTATLINNTGIENALEFNIASTASAMSAQEQESAASETLAHGRASIAGMKTEGGGTVIFGSQTNGTVQTSPSDRPVGDKAEPSIVKVAAPEMKAGGYATGDESDSNLDWLGSEAAARRTPENARWTSGWIITPNESHQIQVPQQPADDVSSQTWRPLIDRLAADMVGHLRVGKQEAVLQLDPPELGKVQVSLRIEEGKLHAHIVADANGAKDLIENHLPELHQALRAGQFEVVEVRVSQGSGHAASQDFARNQQQSHQHHDGHGQNFGSASADDGLRAERHTMQSRSNERGRVSMWA